MTDVGESLLLLVSVKLLNLLLKVKLSEAGMKSQDPGGRPVKSVL